jgi:hypothetical protein
MQHSRYPLTNAATASDTTKSSPVSRKDIPAQPGAAEQEGTLITSSADKLNMDPNFHLGPKPLAYNVASKLKTLFLIAVLLLAPYLGFFLEEPVLKVTGRPVQKSYFPPL